MKGKKMPDPGDHEYQDLTQERTGWVWHCYCHTGPLQGKESKGSGSPTPAAAIAAWRRHSGTPAPARKQPLRRSRDW